MAEKAEMAGGRKISGAAFGVRVHGRLPRSFEPYLLPAGDGAEPGPARELRVAYRCVEELRRPAPGDEEIWSSATETGGRFALFHRSGGFRLDVADLGRGRFEVSPGALEIEWTAEGTGAPHYLFTYALPLWLETEGVPVLHASAVSTGELAVAFVGPSGAGKSVLCAELLRHGCGFVADDGLALRRRAGGDWWCSPGPRLLRLWPSGLARRSLEAGVAIEGLPRVHESIEKRAVSPAGLERGDGSAPAADRPLAAVYVLRRRPEASGGVAISDLAPRDALVELLGHGVAGAPAAALGRSARRLDLLTDLARKVPVRRLDYPSGTDSAARLLEAITPA